MEWPCLLYITIMYIFIETNITYEKESPHEA